MGLLEYENLPAIPFMDTDMVIFHAIYKQTSNQELDIDDEELGRYIDIYFR